jgi:hypothetical protein
MGHAGYLVNGRWALVTADDADPGVPSRAARGYSARMPQKPQVRAKEKRRLTRRLVKWRAQHEQQAAPAEAASATSEKKERSRSSAS